MKAHPDTILFNLNALSDLAKLLKQKDDFVNNLAAVAINSNIIDFSITLLIEEIEKRINMSCQQDIKSVIKVNPREFKGERLSLRLQMLENYEFPNKSKIKSLMGEFKNDRDEIFHKLVTSEPAFFTKRTEIKRLNENADKLRVLIESTIRSIWESEKDSSKA